MPATSNNSANMSRRQSFNGKGLTAVEMVFDVDMATTASSPEAHQFLNVIIGFGIAGSGFGPILAVVGRAASPEKRSLALGITTAAGSAGQVVGPPFAAILLSILPWPSVFVVFALISLLTIVLVPLLKSNPKISKNETEENLRRYNIPFTSYKNSLGMPSNWVELSQEELIKKAGFKFWNPLEVIILHLSYFFRFYSTEFVGIQDSTGE